MASDKGFVMKIKSKGASLPVRAHSKIDSENVRRQKAWRRIGLRLVAIFLIIVFLASECATLLPVK
jgi:hypothetical protein